MQATYAQKLIQKSYPANLINELKINTEYANIKIESYNKDEIRLEIYVDINDNMDNDAYRYNTQIDGSVFTISSELDCDSLNKKIILKDKEGVVTIIPDQGKGIENIKSYEENYTSINYGYETDITLKIKIPRKKSLNIKSIYGNLIINGDYKNIVANITYGDIEIVQPNIARNATIDINSTYGHIDYSVPSSADIQFNLATSYGEIFTDLDMTYKKGGLSSVKNCQNEHSGQYILNTGGNLANITATYDNIYLRGN